jgi:hypothetical protein
MEKIEGRKGVLAEGKHFSDMVQEFHSLEVSDPIIADQFFSCSMKMDVTYKEDGRNTTEELCL